MIKRFDYHLITPLNLPVEKHSIGMQETTVGPFTLHTAPAPDSPSPCITVCLL